MATRLTIAVGQPVVIKDGTEEWKIIFEGTIDEINTIGGTSKNEVKFDPPLKLDVG